jgi:Flp pilus assembly pilin Flp
MGQSDEDSRATDRAARTKLLMDAIEVAAASANPVVEVIVPSVAGGQWKRSVPLIVEIRVASLPGGMLTAFPAYQTSEGTQITIGPPLLLDPADPQAGGALVGDIESLFALGDGDPAAPWQVRALASGGSPEAPADEPWLERPTHSAVLERLRAVRTGRGGEVALALVEAPRWVMRLSVSGRPGNLRVRGRLIDRLVAVPVSRITGDRRTGKGSLAEGPPRWRGGWRLRGEFPDPSRMLKEIREAILAQAPEAAGAGGPAIAVRLERNASASSAAEDPTKDVGVAWITAWFLSFALAIVLAPTTGFFAAFHLGGEYGWLLGAIAVYFVTTVLTIPAWVAGDLAGGIAERLNARWSVKRWVRRAAVVGTYAALFAAVALLPYWAAVLALSVCGAIGLALLKRRHR